MSQMDEQFMQQALELARLGGRAVAPNPMVGAVIVKDGEVIGEGYHEQFGGPHAEVKAIQSVKRKADLEGATMYVTLEPCRHWGKTPPCLDFVEVMGIFRIVVGSRDPFQQKPENRNPKPETNSKSQKSKLKTRFLSGRVAKECKKLNKFFFKWVTEKRPYVTVKIAMSADGFVAGADGKPFRFTTPKEDSEVHQLRADHQAILVGINTVINDDPRLTVRHVEGEQPLRVVLDTHLRIPKKAKVLKDDNVLIATSSAISKSRLQKMGVSAWESPTKTKVCLKRLLKYLGRQGITSVLVEPGPTLYQSLKKQGLIDELIVYKSKKKLISGLAFHL